MTEHDLLSLVRSQALTDLEQAWQTELEDPGDAGVYRQTVETLCENDSLGTALQLATSMVDALAERDRVEDAISVARVVVEKGAHNESFARKLFELLSTRFGGEDWYDLVLGLSELGDGNLTTQAFATFDKARCFTEGNVLYHRGGWGEGVIERLDCNAKELQIRFAGGRLQDFPLTSALESLRPLDEEDLRAMRLINPTELERLSQEEPAVLIRKAARIYRGKITSTQVKKELCPSVVPTKKWATFWKKAKTAAANDPWLQVEGSQTRPTFVLRKRPLSVAEEAERSIGHCQTLGEVIALCRDYIERNQNEDAQKVILELVRQHVETALQKQTAGQSSDDPAEILDGILVLEQHGIPTTVSPAEELRAMLEGPEGEIQPAAIERLATKAAREHAVALLPQALGDDWHEVVIDKITEFPSPVLEAVVTTLQEAKHANRLVKIWPDIAPYPSRYSVLLFLIGKLYAEGEFDNEPSRPELVSVNRVQLHLARIVAVNRKANPELLKIRSRLTSLMIGRRALLTRCLDTIERDDLAAFLGIAERAGPEFPREITDAILRTVAKKHPDLTSKPERPFWEDEDRLFVTAKGLARQQAEYKVLVDEKIPANSAAIGAAASHGDLSENSEWDAAMEEQRNLAARAEVMRRELKMARLIEEQELPEGVVAPGTRVAFRVNDSEETRHLTILGPWDVDDDAGEVINYRAPFAKRLLGKKPGDEGSFEGPDGVQEFRVESVDRVM